MRPSFGGDAEKFLSSVLYERGPEAVSYTEDNNVKWTIREHLSDLIKAFNLVLKVEKYTAPDGRTLNLLKADGTVPIYYQGVKYNIPVLVLLPEKYPFVPPTILVVPTANMVIKSHHEFVDYKGGVATPCLRSWLYPHSTLQDTVTEMCILFGTDPPLFAKPDNHPHPTPPPHSETYQQTFQQTFQNPMQQGSSHSPYQPSPQLSPSNSYTPQTSAQYPHVNTESQSAALSNSSAMGSHPQFGAAYGYNPYGATAQQPQPNQGPAAHSVAAYLSQVNLGPYSQTSATHAVPAGPTPEQQRAELERIFKDVAVKAVVTRLSSVATGYYQKVRQELERLTEARRKLLAHSQELQKGIQGVLDERLAVEALVKELASKADQMNRWLQDNEWKAPEAGSPQVEFQRVIKPADAVAGQQLQSTSEDMALEDAIDVLDRALQDGKVPAETYLKQVRMLARRQFFARALTMKTTGRPSSGPAPQTASHLAMLPGPPGPSAMPHAPPGYVPATYHPYPLLPNGPMLPSGMQPPPPGFNTGMLTNPLAGGR